MQLTFIETALFSRLLPGYLTDDEFAQLQQRLLTGPTQGVLIKGTGGFRKLRWVAPSNAKGKRSGLRIIYYYLPATQEVWLFTLYRKGEMLDLTPDERSMLSKRIHSELKIPRK